MNEDAIGCLVCPHCGEGLRVSAGAVSCAAGHAFDVARSGYVNLLPGDARTGTADTAEMVAARERFLGAGHYAPLAGEIAAMATRIAGHEGDGPDPSPGCVVEVGAGTGYYLSAVLDALAGVDGLALDISKHAARRAARSHPRVGAVVCDAWHALPVRSGAARLVLDVFAPRNAGEFARVLSARGALIVAIPTAEHLAEVVGPLGMLSVAADKDERVHGQLGGWFTTVESVDVRHEMTLSRDDVHALVAMGPSAYHTDPDELARRIGELAEPLAVTLSVRVKGYLLDIEHREGAS